MVDRMDPLLSPALSATSDFSDMTDEELDSYFASYVPLSNLPTPPPAKENIIVPDSISSFIPSTVTEVQRQTPELEVYATQLSNLVPTNASPQRPDIAVVCGLLERADLPVDVIAFAACILDALSQRFASSWRTCLTPGQSPSLLPSRFNLIPQLSSCPELIILSALALAHDFIDDRGRTTKHWSRVEARSLFTIREIEATKFCILADMDYGLFRITEGMVNSMVKDMQRVGNLHSSIAAGRRTDHTTEKDLPRSRMSLELPGAAVWVHGVQTPEPSP